VTDKDFILPLGSDPVEFLLTGRNISEGFATSFFMIEDGGLMFLRYLNRPACVPGYTASHLRRPTVPNQRVRVSDLQISVKFASPITEGRLEHPENLTLMLTVSSL
jgi:hypothetical protein